ncbi:hypothetical protein [Ahrensia sp. R2A130]|uniref:hypothetical protein n=1 Tax=Ahrensia sp. R2A130 TaxID=744979 RepID=UPI0001E0B518|nr:hypothetical protein [Ahrensia sp. R2A130]EFL88294.1 putative lipopolysaccharide biosynthesis [Ahrensia sp. R2A130]
MADKLNADTMDAIARRDDAKAQLLAGRASATDGKGAIADAAKKALEEANASSKAAEDNRKPGERDLSGMTNLLSDSNGEFAKSAEQAQVGGIGVVNSNSEPKPSEDLSDAEAKVVADKIKQQKGGK